MRAKASKHVYIRVGKLNVDLQQGADRLVLAYHSKTWDVSVQMVLNGEEARELSRALAECADALGPGTTLDRELDRMLDEKLNGALDAGDPLGPGLDPDAPTTFDTGVSMFTCPECLYTSVGKSYCIQCGDKP